MDIQDVGSFAAGELQSAGGKITDFMDNATATASDYLNQLGERLKATDIEVIVDKVDRIRSVGIVSIVLIIIAALFVIRLLSKPVRIAFKLIMNAIVGFALLFAINFFGGQYGVSVEITWLSALITGVFGIPGLAVLMILRFIKIAR